MMRSPWGVVAVLVATFALGWGLGFKFEAGRFEDFRIKVAAEARAAQLKLDEAVKQHEETTKQITFDYQTELVELHGYYGRMLDDGSGSRSVPTVPRATQGANGTPSCKPVPVVTKECAETALKLRELQNWVNQMSK